MNRLFLGALALALLSVAAYAQQHNQTPAQPVSGAPINRSTVNNSTTIATSGTFQTILASTQVSNTTIRQAITIENNNAAGPNCWIFWGTGTATTSNSVLLPVGGSYTRYWPFVPSDALQATCGANGTTIYVEVQ